LSFTAEVDGALNRQVYWSNVSPQLLFKVPSAGRATPENGIIAVFVEEEQE
jgi:hypothetical protein